MNIAKFDGFLRNSRLSPKTSAIDHYFLSSLIYWTWSIVLPHSRAACRAISRAWVAKRSAAPGARTPCAMWQRIRPEAPRPVCAGPASGRCGGMVFLSVRMPSRRRPRIAVCSACPWGRRSGAARWAEPAAIAIRRLNSKRSPMAAPSAARCEGRTGGRSAPNSAHVEASRTMSRASVERRFQPRRHPAGRFAPPI